MIMCYFVARFFADSVGEKSIQAVLAARSQAIKNRRPVWKAVAAGLCMNTYRRHGLMDKAADAEREFESARVLLPIGLRVEEMGDGEMDAEGEEEDVDADGDIDVVG